MIFDNGQEYSCVFKYEEQVDQMMDYISLHFPNIKLVSAAARRKRSYERTNPSYKWVALTITLLGSDRKAGRRLYPDLS